MAGTSQSPPTLRRRFFELLELGGHTQAWGARLDLFMSSLIIANCIAAVLETVPRLETRYGVYFGWFEVASIAVYTVEYVLRLWACVEYPPHRQHGATAAPWQRRLRFARQPMMVVDLLAFLPFYIQALFPDLRILRIFRLVRLLKLARYSPGMASLSHVLRAERRALAGAFLIMLSVALVAATGIYYFERMAQPNAFGTVPGAMWWALSTLTTVGYGDVVPITSGGRIFGGLVMITGLGLFALPIAIIASGFASEIHRREFVLRWGLVAAVPLFQGLPAAMIAHISHLLRTRMVTPGTVLLEQGDATEQAYFIVSGVVDIKDGGTETRLSEGGYFGMQALVRRGRAKITVVAASQCQLLVLEAADYRLLLSEEPALRARIRELGQGKPAADYGHKRDLELMRTL